MPTTWDGTADRYLDTRDLEEYAEDEDNDPDIIDQIVALRDEGISDWYHGETLIRDDEFVDHARTFAEDIGAIDGDTQQRWPLYCIDWEAAAKDLQMDYTSVEFLGVDYWVRS